MRHSKSARNLSLACLCVALAACEGDDGSCVEESEPLELALNNHRTILRITSERAAPDGDAFGVWVSGKLRNLSEEDTLVALYTAIDETAFEGTDPLSTVDDPTGNYDNSQWLFDAYLPGRDGDTVYVTDIGEQPHLTIRLGDTMPWGGRLETWLVFRTSATPELLAELEISSRQCDGDVLPFPLGLEVISP